MSEEAQLEVIELAVKAVEIVKRFAHESVNADSKRRAHIRKIIDEVAGEMVHEAQAD